MSHYTKDLAKKSKLSEALLDAIRLEVFMSECPTKEAREECENRIVELLEVTKLTMIAEHTAQLVGPKYKGTSRAASSIGPYVSSTYMAYMHGGHVGPVETRDRERWLVRRIEWLAMGCEEEWQD